MGCDIHLYCEINNTVDNVKAWRTADRFKLDHYDNKFQVASVFSDRDYALFTALAGVMDGAHEVAILSQPRGFPVDAAAWTQSEYDAYGIDAHSASYVTLDELYNYQDKNPQFRYSGLISPEAAKELDENGTHPRSWCQGTSDKSYVRRDWQAEGNVMDDLIKAVEKRAKEELWIYAKGRIALDRAKDFRIVFFFDN